MIKRYVISRHQATIDWVHTLLTGELEVYNHLDQALFEHLRPGDQLIGNLPLEWIAKLTDKRVEYWSISLDYTQHPEWRGKDLSTHQMAQLNPSVCQYALVPCHGSLF